MCVCAVGGLPDSRATPLTRMAEGRGRNGGRVAAAAAAVEGRVEVGKRFGKRGGNGN